MRDINLHSLVRHVIGDIYPVGESNEDEKRLQGLYETIDLVYSLLADIRFASSVQSNEASAKRIGNVAKKFIEELKYYQP